MSSIVEKLRNREKIFAITLVSIHWSGVIEILRNDVLDFLAERFFPMANPEHAMNFGEEVLEFTAAVLFACAFAVALMERTPAAFDRLFPAPPPRPRLRRSASLLIASAAVAALALPVVLLAIADDDPWAFTSDETLAVVRYLIELPLACRNKCIP